MDNKVLTCEKNASLYRRLAETYMNNGDYERAFSFLFSALATGDSIYETYGCLGDAYSEIGQFEKAVEYWFKFLFKAPRNKHSLAYEKLAINYLYQEKMFEAGYYLRKKINNDGFVSKEAINEDIFEEFASTINGKNAYHIAYPFERADFSHEKEISRKIFSAGDYCGASALLEKIPKECMDEESFGDKAIAYFFQGDNEKAIQTCRDSIKHNGENLTAFCNLSTFYSNTGQLEKSKYYYDKALMCYNDDSDKAYILASCAIEQEDNERVYTLLKKIISERKFDLIIRIYLGISAINLHKFDEALKHFSFALKVYPLDRVTEYYFNLSKRLVQGEDRAIRELPLNYLKDYPQTEIRRFKKLIKDFLLSKKDSFSFKKKENLNALLWGINCVDDELNKECALILWYAKGIDGRKILTELLMDIDVRASVKRIIIYTLLVFGYREKFGVIAGNRFKKIKRAKLSCDNIENGVLFTSAYATTLARMAFWEVEADKRVAKIINRLYDNHRNDILAGEYSVEEISVIVICSCGVEGLNNEEEISNLFGVEKDRVVKMINVLKGEENA